MTVRNLFIGMIFPAVLFACIATDLLPAPSSSPTQLTTDSLGTIVVQTARVLATQTAAAVPSLSPTPRPFITLEPPIPTLRIVIPPTVDTSILNETSLTRTEDGSTIFRDQNAGYEIAIPAGWLIVRINSPEYFAALTLPEAADPAIQRALANIQYQNSKLFRLFALDTRPGHVQHQYSTALNLVWDHGNHGSLENSLRQIVEQYPKLFNGVKMTNPVIRTNQEGLQFGIVESEWKTINISNQEFTLYQEQIVTKLDSGTLVVTLSTVDEMKDNLKSDMANIIDTISIASP